MAMETLAHQQEQFAQFLAWQAGNAPVPADERPTVTIADVLKALVNSARLADEATVRTYHAAIDDAFPADTPDDTTTTDPVLVEPTPTEPVPVDPVPADPAVKKATPAK